jgi:hypothetical protein
LIFYFYANAPIFDVKLDRNMTLKKPVFNNQYYFYGNRLLTHILFWVGYYLFFSLLWAKEGNYYASFGLEFILMPVRILASYTVLYYLIPKYLERQKEQQFLFYYFVLIIAAGLLQRIFSHFFYDLLFNSHPKSLWDLGQALRSIVLINTTVLLLTAMKIFQMWKRERSKNEATTKEVAPLIIRSEKRNHLILPQDIYYIEGLGNYITYYLANDKRLISYNSLKKVEGSLPNNFKRIHKSFIINKNHVDSYSTENVEIRGRILPLGKSVAFRID